MPIGCCWGMNGCWVGNGGRAWSGENSDLVFFSFFSFFTFLSLAFSFFLIPFEDMDSPSPITSVFIWASENSLASAPCKDLPMGLSFCLDFFVLVSIDSFPRSRSSTVAPCSPKLAKRSGQFLAIKSWISSSLQMWKLGCIQPKKTKEMQSKT